MLGKISRIRSLASRPTHRSVLSSFAASAIPSAPGPMSPSGSVPVPRTSRSRSAQMEAAFRAIEICPVPVIAQISGVAAGAGCQLALACDIRVVATSARIGMPIARLGIRPSPAFAARLVRVVGPAVAAELHYTGRLVKGPDAVTTGLANRCVYGELLASTVRDLVEEIGSPADISRACGEGGIDCCHRPSSSPHPRSGREFARPPTWHRANSAYVSLQGCYWPAMYSIDGPAVNRRRRRSRNPLCTRHRRKAGR